MKKSQIETHSDGYRASNPAINVKVYRSVSVYKVMDRFKCSEETARKAMQYSFDMQSESFWESAQELADFYLGKGYKVYSEGRSNGWLVVHNMAPLDSWNAIAVNKWGRFERKVKMDIAWRMSEEIVFGDIEANDWAPADAEVEA